MKKQITTILVVVFMGMVCVKTHAADIRVEIGYDKSIYFNIINDDKELEVTYYILGQTYYGNVDIPEEVTYDNITRRVTSIGDSAFAGCSIRNISIPKSVNRIGRMASFLLFCLMKSNSLRSPIHF